MPEHYAIQFSADDDVDGFYQREVEYRRRLVYPPFANLARLEYRDADPLMAEAEAHKLAGRLKVKLDAGGFRQTEMIGPVPCFFAKEYGEYRWQIVLRGPNPASVLRETRSADWRIEIDPISLLFSMC